MRHHSSAWRVLGRISLEMPYTVVSTPSAGGRLIQFETKDEPVHVPGQGALIRRQTVALVPLHTDWIYTLDLMPRLEEDLKTLREMATFAGVKNFNGYIYLIGDESLDSKRFSFKKDNHRLVIEDAELRWPDGTPVEGP